MEGGVTVILMLLIVFGGIAALVVLAWRERRPLLLSLLAALAVSLIVNDSPNDVVIEAGIAIRRSSARTWSS